MECSECGSTLSFGPGAVVAHCAHCRAWSVVGQSHVARLRAGRLLDRLTPETAAAALARSTRLAGLGAPENVESNLVWTSVLARRGTATGTGRDLGGRVERRHEGLIGVALESEFDAILELSSPIEEEAPAEQMERAGLSLDAFDALVRKRIRAEIEKQARAEGWVPGDIDIHVLWTREVHLISLPVLWLTYRLTPKLGPFESVVGQRDRRFRAAFELHDGKCLLLELPEVRSQARLAGAIGLTAALVLLTLFGLVLSMILLLAMR